MGNAIEFDKKLLVAKTLGLEALIKKSIVAVMRANAPQVENYMKSNAPWTDRTSNARNTLGAQAAEDGQYYSIILSHGVPYGVYLETIQSGKFRIIEPTIRSQGPKVMAQLNGLLSKI